jgi:hypothetical protein
MARYQSHGCLEVTTRSSASAINLDVLRDCGLDRLPNP